MRKLPGSLRSDRLATMLESAFEKAKQIEDVPPWPPVFSTWTR